ncbi:MAG: hypothetical protein FJ024_09300, partial [Chloroflexi bacterium]|nr:hypothetical protein [Chloroflexota bacterium]
MQQVYPCPRCGNALYFNDRVCGYCGLTVTWQSPQQPPYQY